MEPLLLLAMVFDAMRNERERAALSHPNRLVTLWLVGSVILHFVGAGVWGFGQTLPQANR